MNAAPNQVLMIPGHRTCSSRNYPPPGVRIDPLLSHRLTSAFLVKAQLAARLKPGCKLAVPEDVKADMPLSSFASANGLKQILAELSAEQGIRLRPDLRTLQDLSDCPRKASQLRQAA